MSFIQVVSALHEQVEEDEGTPMNVNIVFPTNAYLFCAWSSSLFKCFICLALPFKRVKLTSESVHVTVWPKGVSGQAAETHMQTVTGESPGNSQPPQQPTKKKVLAEPDAIKAKDIGPRKRKLSVSAQVNKPHINI